MSKIAVLTADVVNSTSYESQKVTVWLDELLSTMTTHAGFEWALKPEIFRGDSFQCALKNPDQVMRLAVLSRATIKKNAPDVDLRIAIGIGKADKLTDRPGTSDGEAFRLSGHLADNMRKQKARIAIALPDPSEPLTAIMGLLETLIESWTPAQSEVIMALLQNDTMTKISERLSISQPATSQRVTAAKWWAIDHFLKTFPDQLALYQKTDSKS